MISFGGRAIEDLSSGHECEVNRTTGAATLSVPVPLPPGRNGFGPSFALTYNSGGGNSPFGSGWALTGLPTIGIDTREHVARWDGSDLYQISGDELVPWLTLDGAEWQPRGFVNADWSVAFLRSRTGGPHLRVEKWVHRASGRVHFRTRDARNTVTIFGARPDGRSRITDPNDPTRTFVWLPEVQRDSAGNAIWFEYEPETLDGVDRSTPFERRAPSLAQRYLKRIRYGNAQPVNLTDDLIAGTLPPGVRWCFQGVFDYGDHSAPEVPPAVPDSPWLTRPDPFSTCRAGFEIRTYRLCRRILSFHDFDELGAGPTLTGALVLTYDEDVSGSMLREIAFVGHRRDGAVQTSLTLPALRMTYAGPFVAPTFLPAPVETQRNTPAGLAASHYSFVDLFGDGLPGIVAESERSWFYKANEGNGRFGEQVLVVEKPQTRRGAWAFGDVDRDGNTDLSQLSGRLAGLFSHDRDARSWEGFRPFEALPHVEGLRRAQWVDLNGDGRPDIVIPKGSSLSWFASDGDGFAAPMEVTVPAATFPTVTEDPMLDLYFADMNGDGLVDLVRVSNGRVEYWPSLGNGRFGESVLFEGSPRFTADDEFDTGRLRFIDLDGSGTTDIIYLGRGEVSVWHNASGNSITPGPRLGSLPYFDSVSTIGVLDFLGDGRPCLVWSSPLPGLENSLYYLPLAAVERPRLLLSLNDALGQETRFTYSSSATHYLRDQRSGTPWTTRLPNHMSVVDQREVRDAIGNTLSVQRFEYHDGFYDGVERQFCGFGRVDVYDLAVGATGPEPGVTVTAPSLVRTWTHVGTATRHPPFNAYDGDVDLPLLQPHVIDAAGLTAGEIEDAMRSLVGRVIRSETWSIDELGTPAAHPFQVMQASYRVVRAQPAAKGTRAAFDVIPEETLNAVYEQAAGDPRLSHSITVAVGSFAIPEVTAEIAYARRAGRPRDVPAQNDTTVLIERHGLVHFDTDERFELGIPIEGSDFELTGAGAGADRITPADLRAAAVTNALNAPSEHHETPPPGIAARRLSWDQSFYWNNNQTAALPFGQVGTNVLVHHEESACFAPTFVANVYQGRVDGPMLNAAGYVERDGLLWQSGETHFFGSAAIFFQREALEQPNGSRSSFEYDSYALEVTAQTDAITNRIAAVIDYHTLAPSRITDANGNISEVRYDPLGVIITSTSQGHVQAQPWGFDAMNAIVMRAPPNAEDVIAQPEHYLQGASQFVYYDLHTWQRDGTPPVTVRLTREELRRDGLGGVLPNGRVQIAVTYLDGLGRALQTKTLVEPGPAIQRDGGGAVVVDGQGRPELAEAAERWQVSGHIVYDAKQKPRQRYEPYFSPTWRYESDAVLRQFGVATLINYDAVGRETEQFFANGTQTRTTYGAWSVERADANDTVMDSTYRTARQALPAADPERQALDHAIQHAGTNITTFFDPAGRVAGLLESGGATADDRRSESRFDAQSNVVELIDPRSLTAYRYVRDMQARVVHIHSMDAGDSRTFYDAQNRQLLMWDARGYEIEQAYDILDRPTTLDVRGNGLDHRVEERAYGGNDPAAVANNLNGMLVRVRDQAGEAEITRFDPMGQPLATTRRIRTETGEVDWRAAVPLDPTEFVTEVAYDAIGRLRQAVLPDDSTRTLSYVRGGGLERVNVSTGDGKVVDVDVLNGATYNARGQRSRVTLGNGVAIEYLYDPDTFRLTRQTAAIPARTFQDAQYTYDPAGNIVRIVDNALTGPNAIVTGSVLPPRRDYAYDAHYRLMRATGRVHQALLEHDYIPAIGGPIKGTRHITLNNGAALESFTRHYEYDAANNLRRVRHVGATQSWTTDMWISPASNRSIPALDEGGVAIPTPENRFDAAGNLAVLAHLRRIDWSWRSTLSRAVIIERPGDIDDDEVYTYGADGMRVRKVTTRRVNGNGVETIEKIYFGDCERKRITRNGALILERWTSHFRSDDERIALLHRWTRDDNARETDDIAPARFRYQLSTHQGSSAIELDENGAVVSYEEYFPYGGSSFIAGDQVRDVTIKEYRYSGKERDDATNLYYYGHRYYAPWTFRWLSPDPLGPKDDLNLYQFVLGDPVGNVDPDGLQTQTRGRFDVVETSSLPVWARPIWQRLTPEQRLDAVSPGGRMAIVVIEGVAQHLPREEAVRRLEAARLEGADVTRYDLAPPPPPPPEIPPDAPSEVITFEEAEIVVAGPIPDQPVTLATGEGEESGGTGGTGARRTRTRSGGSSSGGRRRSSGSRRGRGSQPGAGGGRGTNGTGTGTGTRGNGTGGGGTSETVPAQPAAADGAGEGTTGGSGSGTGTGNGTGTSPTPPPTPPPPGARTGPSDGGPPQTGDPEGRSRRGSQNGSREGSEGGSPGANGRRPGANGTGRSTAGGATGASGTGTDTGGVTAPGLDPSTQGQPAPPGLQQNGTDVNGAVDGDPNATRDASRSQTGAGGQPDGSRQGTPTGSAQGTAGGSREGRAGGDSTTGNPNASREPESALDVATRWAGYANFEFSQGGPNGQRGGIPGGSGRFNLGWAGQVLYIGLTVVSWIGPGAILKGFKLGLRLGMRGLSALARGGLALGRKALTAVGRGISNLTARYFSTELRAAGFKHTRAAVMAAFRAAEHTPLSREVLEAITSGQIKLGLSRRLAAGGTTSSAGRISVNSTMHIDDVLSTIVHEGQHALDIARGRIPLPSAATLTERAFAELRAFRSAAEFAVQNNLTRAAAHGHYRLGPRELAISIAESYPSLRGITDAELMQAVIRFLSP